jgi:hypothetical protein
MFIDMLMTDSISPLGGSINYVYMQVLWISDT